jgi:hypothetical protein
MPLVSGVCRAASAPMLSHGGSRLNASKPEANPKTSYPFKTLFQKQRLWSVCLGSNELSTECFELSPSHRLHRKTLQFESPFKRTLPSGGLDGAKYMKNSRELFFFTAFTSEIPIATSCPSNDRGAADREIVRE